ncbi:MAG: HAD-IIB family hydrolase [Verrucomicrobiales bacterium]|nr:HAD-IIB family hydrolase [Verrucomicrobiae bacterium]MCP5552920.1 HAD-IIB family hydrolase [Akkermansiaceae bacterium]
MRIQLHSLHGLFRACHLEIGRDADNGGQIVYVMELAKELSQQPEVTHVDLFTRRIDDPTTDPVYSRAVEEVNEKFSIRRIWCGGKKYLPKEKLWPHLDEYVANAITSIKQEKLFPDWIHGHYADAGYIAAELSSILNVPFCQTGHSLGKPKLRKLIDSGMLETDANTRYQFQKRFAAEDTTLVNAEFIVTSTTQEISTYEVYDSFDRAEFHVIPPGLNFDRYFPYYHDLVAPQEIPVDRMQAKQATRERLANFLSHPDKPFILALCRPDVKKNIDGLLHAYGTDKSLQALANLVIFAGIRSNIETMPEGEREVLTELLLLMDRYNLYGKLAIPKKHDVGSEVPEIYRLCAERKGVFINIALTEPFGLTILEATASGCPVVATEDGGPAEILPKCQNGTLVPPQDTEAIQKALREILVDPEEWNKLSNRGIENVREHYSWQAHVSRYLELIKENHTASAGLGKKNAIQNPGTYDRLKRATRMMVTDVDGTLVSETGDFQGLHELKQLLRDRGDNFAFGIASGRSLGSLEKLFTEHQLPTPDVVICDVGTRICYGFKEAGLDKAWIDHIDYRWKREAVVQALAHHPGLTLQESHLQSRHKVSYYISTDGVPEESVSESSIRSALGRIAHHASLIVTHGIYLDILPKRASKGRAVRFIGNKWNIPLKETIVFGDAGNDLDMFTGATRGVVVGNHSPAMEVLRKQKRVYFSGQPSAAGILDGLQHFQFSQGRSKTIGAPDTAR